jgi:hypothetical protein
LICASIGGGSDSALFDRAGSCSILDSPDVAAISSTPDAFATVRLRVERAGGSADTMGSEDGTVIISTSSLWLDESSGSKSDAGLFSGDDARFGRSSAPPMMALWVNRLKGD